MSISSRFAVAVHTLTLLALDGHSPVTSERIASSVNTNPVVIRRLLGRLSQAGLVSSQPGARGGAMLARRPEEITLLDVFRAVEATELFSLHHHRPDPECQCGRHIQPVMSKVFIEAESAMEQELASVTVAQVLQEVQAADSLAGSPLPADRKQSNKRHNPGQEAEHLAKAQGS